MEASRHWLSLGKSARPTSSKTAVLEVIDEVAAQEMLGLATKGVRAKSHVLSKEKTGELVSSYACNAISRSKSFLNVDDSPVDAGVSVAGLKHTALFVSDHGTQFLYPLLHWQTRPSGEPPV